MIQLEQKVYTKSEIAEFLGINLDKNFKRNVENTLSKWGYEYEFPPYSKTISITYVPTGEYKLAEILMREYEIDIQVNPIEFACFIHAFNYIEGFFSMPWGQRAKVLKDTYTIEVCDRTLRNWTNKLIATGTITKSDNEKTYWKSAKISDETTLREPAAREEYMAFYKYKNEEYKKNISELIITGKEDLKEVKSKAYQLAHLAAMDKFGGWCFYSCKSFFLSSFDDKNLTEIFELVEEIAPELADYTSELWAQAREQVKQEITQGGFIF